MRSPIDTLNQLSLSEFKRYFASLQAPNPGSLRGFFKGYFVGPGWLRKSAQPLLTITGMGDWRGKYMESGGMIINLVQTKDGLERKLPMHLIERDSIIDGRGGIALCYEGSNPFPWPWMTDEIRSIQADWLLGMTIVQWGALVRLPLPFVLHSRESADGF